MERQLKQRVVGAALLVAFGVIFIPLFLDNDALDAVVPPAVDIPPPPDTPPDGAEPLDAATIDTLGRSIDAPLAAPAAPAGSGASAAAQVPELVEEVIAATAPEESPPAPPAPPAPPLAPVVKPPPSTPPAPAEAGNDPTVSGWAIQLGSFASEDNARRLLERLRGAGYTAYLEKHREGSSTVFKVRVGPERQRAAAEQLRDRLEREFATKGMLRPYR